MKPSFCSVMIAVSEQHPIVLHTLFLVILQSPRFHVQPVCE